MTEKRIVATNGSSIVLYTTADGNTQQVPFYNLDMVISVGYRIVALTLMIAESRTEEKDVMVKVVVNLINKDNQ